MAVEVPADRMIERLRNEVANLNDAKIALEARTDFQEAIINGLQQQIISLQNEVNSLRGEVPDEPGYLVDLHDHIHAEPHEHPQEPSGAPNGAEPVQEDPVEA